MDRARLSRTAQVCQCGSGTAVTPGMVESLVKMDVRLAERAGFLSLQPLVDALQAGQGDCKDHGRHEARVHQAVLNVQKGEHSQWQRQKG